MSQQAPCPIEALVDAAGTVSIEKHIDVSPVSQLHIEICLLFFTNRRTTESERPPSFLVLSHTQGGGSEGCFNCRRTLRQFGVDHRCDLFPQQGIILDFVMWFIQVAHNPGIVVAIDSTIPICHLEIADDGRPLRIRCANVRPPMDDTFRLIKVDGASYVGGNDPILMAGFMNAVDLNRE